MVIFALILVIIFEAIIGLLGEANMYNLHILLSASLLILLYIIIFAFIGQIVRSAGSSSHDATDDYTYSQIMFYTGMLFIIIHGGVCIFYIPKTSLGAIGFVWIAVTLWLIISKLLKFKRYSYFPTDEEISLLSKVKAKKYFDDLYMFDVDISSRRMSAESKAFMEAEGKYYEMDTDIDVFGMWVSSLLKYKKHEWVVVAFEKDRKIFGMWLNKGEPRSVYFLPSLKELVEKCKSEGGRALIRFHNHPNPNSSLYNTLLPSEQDLFSAKWCANIANENQLNWIDCVCSVGKCKKYFSSYASPQIPKAAEPEYLKNQIEKSSNRKISCYLLHKEIGFENCSPDKALQNNSWNKAKTFFETKKGLSLLKQFLPIIIVAACLVGMFLYMLIR